MNPSALFYAKYKIHVSYVKNKEISLGHSLKSNKDHDQPDKASNWTL